MYNPFTIFCYVDKRSKYSDLEEFINEMQRNYPVNVIIEEFNGEDAEWVVRNGKMYLSDEYNAKMCQPVYNKYFNGVDVVGIFIDDDNWKNTNQRLLGSQFGKTHNDYYVFSCKLHRNYAGTGEHEVLHAVDNYVRKYLGIRLGSLFNVKDFDDDIVHAKEYWKKGYYYDDVWKKLALVLSTAIKRKRQQKPVLSFTSLLQRAVESQYLASESIKEPTYKYFKPREIVGLKHELVELLDEAREKAGVAFVITSGLRTEEQNKKVNGVKDSSHLTGFACDLRVRNDQERYKILTALLEVGFTRLGVYKSHIHCDIDPNKTTEVIWYK